MLPLDAFASDRMGFVLWGVCWLSVSAGWVVGSMWVVRDARLVFGRATPWKQLLALAGVAIFLGTVFIGRAALPSLLVVLPLVLAVSYFLARDKASPRSLQWLPWHVLKPLEERLINELGLREWLDRSRLTAEDNRRRATALKSIVLVRHDGVACHERDPALDKREARTVLAVKRLLWKATDAGATAILFEPPAQPGGRGTLRCQVAGALEPLPLPKTLDVAGIAAVVKSLVGLDPAPANQPRYGNFQLISGGHKIEMQAAFGPMSNGEKIMLRAFDPDGLPNIGQLGMSEPMVRKVRDIVLGRQGMLLVAGPPSAGKTTTAFSVLESIDRLKTVIVTIEDRLQYQLDNVLQTTVDKTPEGTVAKRLEALLRQDPAKILFGEIREPQTAEIALRAAASGRLVITTRRAADAAAAIADLLQCGCDPAVLQGGLTAVLAQRLIRLLCPICRKPRPADAEAMRPLGLPVGTVELLYEPQGCEHCLNGFRGCTALYELLVVDPKLRAALVTRPAVDQIRALSAAAGNGSLWHAALARVVAGQTSVAEARRVVS